MERRLLRKSQDKVFGGVCSGLAEYVGVEVTMVRLLSLVGIIVSAVVPGLLLYLICVIIIPSDNHVRRDYYSQDQSYSTDYDNPDGYRPYEKRSSGESRPFFGIVLIVLGVFIFAKMFFNWLDWRYVFAGVLVLIGLSMILRKQE